MEWTTEYINDLPDSSFAYIEPSGTKDGEGKTTPRTLRHLPYKDKDGKVDLPHLRNALARLPQTNLPPEARAAAEKALTAAAKEHGVGDYNKLAELKIPFFRLGRWRHPRYGPIEGTQDKFDAIKVNFRRNVLGRPPYVRLGHTRDGAVTYADAPAEAWVHDIIQEGDTLYALAHPTSEQIVDAVRNKRFRFASPEYQDNYINKETGLAVGPALLAIGLTNEPFLTRLPDAVALADPPETIYLDYKEVKEPMENDFIKKLSEAVTKFFEGLKPVSATGGMTEEERKKLAEIDNLKVQLAQTQEQLADAARTTWAAQVETRLGALVAAGVPPVMCDQAKAVLLANPAMATTMIKLADNKEISLAEQVFATLDALPKEHRIKLGQTGKQGGDPAPDSPEAVKKMADEDVKAMGGKITEDGKYIL
jgi:hypothetical protein